MTAPRLPQLGSVVWAEVEDANGFRKARPAVVVSATDAIAAGQPVCLVAITTRLGSPLPDDHVLLPWDRQGKARSGLRQKCAAVTTWLVEVSVSDIQQVVGHLPPHVLSELLAKVVPGPPLPPAQDPPLAPEQARAISAAPTHADPDPK